MTSEFPPTKSISESSTEPLLDDAVQRRSLIVWQHRESGNMGLEASKENYHSLQLDKLTRRVPMAPLRSFSWLEAARRRGGESIFAPPQQNFEQVLQDGLQTVRSSGSLVAF